MSILLGSRTEKNILTAFAGESQARNRYTFFASKAKSEGYVIVADIFTETSNQEKEHAERLFKFIDRPQACEIEINASYPVGIYDTITNLRNAASGENYESKIMYPNFAKVAREEGFEDIAFSMENIAVAEFYHEKRYNHLVNLINTNKIFTKEEPIMWRCLNCGWVGEGTSAPDRCPACDHEQKYFTELFDNFFV